MSRLMVRLLCIALVTLTVSLAAQAKVEIVQFEDPKKQAIYLDMIAELRCLVCQNQNLADSNAELAVDLRRRTRELIDQGKSRSEIADYMVERYGEFVLYRPRFNSANLVLWLGPLLLLILTLLIAIRRRNVRKASAELSPEERERLRSLIEH